MSIKFSNENLAKLFEVPYEDWQAIHQRVAFLSRDYESSWPFILASNYQELLQVCRNWGDETFPQLVKLSEQIGDCADRAITRLKPLADALYELDNKNVDKIPESLWARVQESADAILELCLVINNAAESLDSQIKKFREVNNAADEDLQAKGFDPTVQGQLLFLAPSSVRAVEAIGLILGEWQTIERDLQYVRTIDVENDDSLITADELQESIEVWRRVREVTKVFKSKAGSLQDIITTMVILDLKNSRNLGF